MIVVSDTSAITSLIQIDRVDLLQHLYERVIIPTAVEKELRREHPQLPNFLEIVPVKDTEAPAGFSDRLGSGESEAIALMLEVCGDLLLMDERKGRRIAKEQGLKVIGLVGVLMHAKQRRLIDALRPVVDDLETRAGFRLSKELKQTLMRNEPGDD